MYRCLQRYNIYIYIYVYIYKYVYIFIYIYIYIFIYLYIYIYIYILFYWNNVNRYICYELLGTGSTLDRCSLSIYNFEIMPNLVFIFIYKILQRIELWLTNTNIWYKHLFFSVYQYVMLTRVSIQIYLVRLAQRRLNDSFCDNLHNWLEAHYYANK